MAPPKIPVFRSFRGSLPSPAEAWSVKTLGPEEKEPARRLAALLDEVASGVETLRANPAAASHAEGLRTAHKGLSVSVPPRFPSPHDTLAACAHALSLGVELVLEPTPAAPPLPPEASPEDAWLRWQTTIPADRFTVAQLPDLLAVFSAFPLKHVWAPWLDKPKPLDAASLQAAGRPPEGRNVSLVLSAGERWWEGDHLLVALTGSRRERCWVAAATLGPEALSHPDLLHRVDAMSRALLSAFDAHGAFLHPLVPLVLDNLACPAAWDAARRDRGGIAVTRDERGWERIDTRARPARLFVAPTGSTLGAAAMMWLGPAQVEALGADAVAGFRSCEANVPLPGGGRFLVLTDPVHMLAEDTLARQEELRRTLDLAAAAERLDAIVPAAATPKSGTGAADEVRRRFELGNMTYTPVVPATAPKRVSFGGGEASVDAAMKLRFAARECRLDGQALVVKDQAGDRRVAFTEVSEVFARQLPPDPPFERALFLDIVPAGSAPVRLMAASRVNYAALPGGAGTTATDNLRRLGRAVLGANAGVQVDADTRAFLEGRPPASFAGLGQFASYDSRFAG